MEKEDLLKELSIAIANTEEDKIRETGKKLIAMGAEPKKIVETISEGMRIIGTKYEKGEVYIAEVLIVSDAVMEVVRVLEPRLLVAAAKPEGKIVVGVVEGDIHDIGKNLVALIFKSSGWEVHDLGRDVPPSKFVEKAKEAGADIVGLSGLMTTDIDAAFKTVMAIKEAGLKAKTIQGGVLSSEEMLRRVGADAFGVDPWDGLSKARELLKR